MINGAVATWNLEWKKKDKLDPSTPCFVVAGKPVKGEDEEEAAADDEEDDLVSYQIFAKLYEMIAHPLSGKPANIKLVPSADSDGESA